MKKILLAWNNLSLVVRIVLGLILGTLLGIFAPQLSLVGIFGTLFTSALQGIAPILVFFLVMGALSQHRQGAPSKMGRVIFLYCLGTVLAALLAVMASWIFPMELNLSGRAAAVEANPPQGLAEVLNALLMNVTQNPVAALVNGNYIGILFWAVLLGLALRRATDATKNVLSNAADGVTQVVRFVISLAPFGIMGLVFTAVSTNGVAIFTDYGRILALLVACMVVMGLVVNPIIVFLNIRRNPYPLVFACLKGSFITAFLTRSSAANIPVNLQLCHDLGLEEDSYAVSIPLGATINMSGAAITITVMTLAAVHTMGISIDMASAILLSIVAAISACGASGVAGGSLLLIPMACSLFGIPSEIAMHVVGIGFIIGVVQDSFETGLNSYTDVLFTATAQFSQSNKGGSVS
ncbi:MAG: serine/threonine transporter SstT [Akkermansia sp.]